MPIVPRHLPAERSTIEGPIYVFANIGVSRPPRHQLDDFQPSKYDSPSDFCVDCMFCEIEVKAEA